MATARCRNCNAENDPAGGLCGRCGQQLENVPERRPEADRPGASTRDDGERIRDRGPQTSSTSEQARRLLKQVSGVLFAVAALQFLCPLGLIVATTDWREINRVPTIVIVGVVVFAGVGALFIGLGVWARYRPLPPVVVGLVVYVAWLVGVLVAVGPERLTKGGGSYMLVGVTAGLIYSLVAASKYNKLTRALPDQH